jgi:hypothetical protein
MMAGADRRDTPPPLRQAAQVAQETAGPVHPPVPPRSVEAPSSQAFDQVPYQIDALQRRNSAAVLEATTSTAPYPPPSVAGATADLKLDTAPPGVEIAQTPRRTARTTVGAAVLANRTSIILALAGLQLQIEDKLTSLRDARSNSDEKHQEIADYEDLKQKVEAVLEAARKFFAGSTEEETLEKDVKSFATTLRNIWDKRHLQYADVGLLVSSVGVCHLMGADPNLATVVCGALVGPKAVVDALQAFFSKGK